MKTNATNVNDNNDEPDLNEFSQFKIDSNPYVKPHRLHDILRLISTLAVTKDSFRSHDGLVRELRDEPRSASNWLIVAYNHPEFFRLGKDHKRFILLHRYLKQPYEEDNKRDKLSEDQTEKLIEQAYTLYDKALASRQRNSYLYPFYGAIIAAFVSIFALFYNNDKANNNKMIDAKLAIIIHKLDSMENTGKTPDSQRIKK